MTKTVKEALVVVDKLNDEYFGKTGDTDRYPFSLVYCTYFMGIFYFDTHCIWDDCDNNVLTFSHMGTGELKTETIMDCCMRNLLDIQNNFTKFKPKKKKVKPQSEDYTDCGVLSHWREE
jgi:hypothetical protein